MFSFFFSFVSSIFTSNGLSVCAQIKNIAVLSFLTKRYFFIVNERKEPGRLYVVHNASRGVLRLSPGPIKLREERAHADHRCMSSWDQQSFIQGGSAQRSKPLFTIFDSKGTPLLYLLLPTNGTPFTYVAKRE